MKHFLLAYDHAKQELVLQQEFNENAKEALAKYEELERKYFNQPRMDIVLIGSDSIESVKITHPTYFPEQRDALMSGLLRYA